MPQNIPCFFCCCGLRISCQHPTGLDLGNRYKDDCEFGDGSFVCVLFQKSFYSFALCLWIGTSVSFQWINVRILPSGPKFSVLWCSLTRQAGLCPPWAEVPSVMGARATEQHCILGEAAACFAFRKWSFALGVSREKKKKGCEGNRMKWEQNVGKTQIALDLYLLDFWSKLTRKITFIANHWRAFL